MKYLISSIIITATILSISSFGDLSARNNEVRLMNVNRILKSCGFDKGLFKNTNKIVDKVDMTDSYNICTLDKDSDTIDTKAEFLTAAYDNINILPRKAQRIINRELPKGKTGAMRLASLWLQKKAENPEKAARYNKALNIIMKKTGVNKYQISRFYAKSMKRKIYAMPLGEPLTPTEQKKAKTLLLDYMVKPTRANARAFRDYKSFLSYGVPKKGDVLAAFVDKLSSGISLQLA